MRPVILIRSPMANIQEMQHEEQARNLLPLSKKKRDSTASHLVSPSKPFTKNNIHIRTDETISPDHQDARRDAVPVLSSFSPQSPRYHHISPNTKQLLLQCYHELQTLDTIWQSYHALQSELLLTEQKDSLLALLQTALRPNLVNDVVDIAYHRNLASSFELELNQCKAAIELFRHQYMNYIQQYKEREAQEYRKIVDQLLNKVTENKKKLVQQVNQSLQWKKQLMQYEQIIAAYQLHQAHHEDDSTQPSTSEKLIEVVMCGEDYLQDETSLDDMAQRLLTHINHPDEYIFHFKLEGILEAMKDRVQQFRLQTTDTHNDHSRLNTSSWRDFPTEGDQAEEGEVDDEEIDDASSVGYYGNAYEGDKEDSQEDSQEQDDEEESLCCVSAFIV